MFKTLSADRIFPDSLLEEILNRIPSITAVASRLDPPYEIRGRGRPVVGKNPVTTPMLTMAKLKSEKLMPIARSMLKESAEFLAILNPLKNRSKKSSRKKEEPTNPNSSPRILKTKSVCGSGRKRSFT
jgi:hypothetical protein